jgi:hypothetical protein
MKRTPELRTLSEDHHHGLVHARRLRRATEADETDSAESVAKGFLDFWQKDTALHFRKEEEVLLPVMARYKGDLSREPLMEMIEDHARIRGLVMQLSDEAIGGNVRLETLNRSPVLFLPPAKRRPIVAVAVQQSCLACTRLRRPVRLPPDEMV